MNFKDGLLSLYDLTVAEAINEACVRPSTWVALVLFACHATSSVAINPIHTEMPIKLSRPYSQLVLDSLVDFFCSVYCTTPSLIWGEDVRLLHCYCIVTMREKFDRHM